MAEYYSFVWIDHLVIIQPCIDGHLGFFTLWLVSNVAMNTGVQIFESLLSNLLGLYQEAKLVGYVVILCLIF